MHREALDYRGMYKAAMRQGDAALGNYHRNVRVVAGGESFMVRVAMDDSQVMDLAVWPEEDILAAIHPHVTHAPRLIFSQRRSGGQGNARAGTGAAESLTLEPEFQVHSFIEGESIDGLYPHGYEIPVRVSNDIAEFFGELLRFPQDELPGLPSDWPTDGDSHGFGRVLLQFGRLLRGNHGKSSPGLFEMLEIPVDPFARLEDALVTLAARPFQLLHGDIHRGNMIWGNGQTFFLDWQLALWGDPVYDLADHVHKMGYEPADEVRAIHDWVRVAPDRCSRGLGEGLDFYLAYERVKSAVVDAVRWSHRIARETEGSDAQNVAVRQLAEKINQARPYWGREFTAPLTPARVARAVAEGGRG
ncbi:aminoglycoside phosphotransferase family protein [Streptomyces sp. NPDC005566]|uniref:aminoglycoside phosphotransferase family protein n=1 Tax=Streptomyces sp. NPDC005566 TaxID=3156886 RepID=UPI00339F9806